MESYGPAGARRLRGPTGGEKMIEAITATVYRAENGRRYFTKRGALYATAKARFFARRQCDCEHETGYRCGVCRTYFDRERMDTFGRTKYHHVVARYARFLGRQMKRV